MYTHLLARLPERAVVSQQDGLYLLSLNVRFPNRGSLTNGWGHTTLYLFCTDVCSPDWLRQQSTQLPTEQQKLGPSILVSRYFGTEESPHAASWAQRSRKLYPSPNMPKVSVGLNIEVPSGVFFFFYIFSKQLWYQTWLLLTTSPKSRKYCGKLSCKFHCQPLDCKDDF